jgi:starvation-inducible outer membrane lipoprotein
MSQVEKSGSVRPIDGQRGVVGSSRSGTRGRRVWTFAGTLSRRVGVLVAASLVAAAGTVAIGATTRPSSVSAAIPAGAKTEISGRPNGIAVLSIGVTNTWAAGWFQVLPCDATPGAYSTSNATEAGETIANLAIVQLDAAGKTCVYNQNPTSDIFVDLQGYLDPSAFTPETRRLLDTRQPPPKLPVEAGGRISFVGRPNGLAVVSIVATQTLAPGYLQVLPCAASPGAYSNLNVDRADQTIANLAVLQLDARGESCIYTQGGGHLIVDLQGYLDPATFTVASQRLLDTRQPPPKTPLPADTRAEVVGQPNGLAVLSIIGSETRAPGYFQLLGCAETEGAYSNLNSDRAGQTRANLAIAQLDGNGKTCLHTQSGAHLIADLQGYFDPSVFTPVNQRILDTRQTLSPPWASGVLLDDPASAARSFMEWLGRTVSDLDPWTIGGVTSNDASAEVEVAYTSLIYDVGIRQLVQPTMTLTVSRSPVHGGWEVSQARSGSLRVDRPLPNDQIGSVFEMSYSNTLISSGPEMRIFVSGSMTPIYQGQFSGGGIFAADSFSGVVDTTLCSPGLASLFSLVTVCNGVGPAGVQGTLVISTNHGATTVPVVFR